MSNMQYIFLSYAASSLVQYRIEQRGCPGGQTTPICKFIDIKLLIDMRSDTHKTSNRAEDGLCGINNF